MHAGIARTYLLLPPVVCTLVGCSAREEVHIGIELLLDILGDTSFLSKEYKVKIILIYTTQYYLTKAKYQKKVYPSSCQLI